MTVPIVMAMQRFLRLTMAVWGFTVSTTVVPASNGDKELPDQTNRSLYCASNEEIIASTSSVSHVVVSE